MGLTTRHRTSANESDWDMSDDTQPVQPITGDWLTIKEAQEFVGKDKDGKYKITDAGLRWLCDRGNITCKKRGKQWFIDPVSLKQYIEKRVS